MLGSSNTIILGLCNNALLHNPNIIVLDEPNNGLDPNGIQEMVKIIKHLKKEGKTVILSTHNLKDVEEICTDFAIFKDGACMLHL